MSKAPGISAAILAAAFAVMASVAAAGPAEVENAAFIAANTASAATGNGQPGFVESVPGSMKPTVGRTVSHVGSSSAARYPRSLLLETICPRSAR